MLNFLKSIFSPPPQRKAKSYTIREGRPVETDEAFEAWTTSDLDKMLKAAEKKTNLIDRHFLLMGIVEETYKQRENKEIRAKLYHFAELHLKEFPEIAPALRKDMGGELPSVRTFQKYATVLAEDENFDRAIKVCRNALSFGLHDGTKSGFEGRIERIQKQKEYNQSE